MIIRIIVTVADICTLSDYKNNSNIADICTWQCDYQNNSNIADICTKWLSVIIVTLLRICTLSDY